ncbi:MAG: disulfide bond formation protein B [Nitrosomonadales bacterium]|jgi:disulfide bond formation protein DsbB|nr:disulfide bond formation protein B [Nitrosomonadales bacterium]MBT6818075.1 disulfide bond formation protein B [Nitrosomonadales bacterium]
MKFNFSFKAINLLAATFSFFLVFLAIFIQENFELEPCPLCITQRIIFIVGGGAFFIFSFFNPSKIARILHLIVLLLINFMGVVFSVRHILIQSKLISVPAECGLDLNYMFDSFPLAEAFELLFRGAGDCSSIDWTLFGITLPQLALLSYLVFIFVTLYIYKKYQK